MDRRAEPPDRAPSVVLDEDIDAVLAEFAGDPRAAIRALLHDLDMLARDHAATVSYGFVRGDVVKRVLPLGRRP